MQYRKKCNIVLIQRQFRTKKQEVFNLIKTLKRLMSEEEGQGMAEYALILAGIAVVVLVAVNAMGDTISGIFTNMNFTGD